MKLIKSLKSLCIVIFTALSLTAVPAMAAGTLPLAMAQQIDINGQPLANCQLTFFVAGTVNNLQNNFADFGLTAPQGNPLNCDQTGRIPMFWLADGLIHIRLTDASGLQIIDTTMQVLGPSSGGGGGGGTVDPTAIMSTGDFKARYGSGPLAGFVRLNGLTMGSSVSGATERANADTQALWIYLYGVDSSLVVSGGRTGNALNDFNANKTIALPDWRGRALAAADDMGTGPAGRLTLATMNGTGFGAEGGGETQTLTVPQVPVITPAGTVTNGAITTTPTTNTISGSGTFNAGNGGTSVPAGGGVMTLSSTQAASTFTGASFGGGAAHPIVQPTKTATFYVKL